MNSRLRMVIVILVLSLILNGSMAVTAESSDEIIFKDENLYNKLSRIYQLDGVFTEEMASNLSEKQTLLVVRDAEISDLEGLQYFDNLGTIYLDRNNLKNLKPLSSLKLLAMLSIIDNSIKGQEFEDSLNEMGKIEFLDTLILSDNGLNSMSF